MAETVVGSEEGKEERAVPGLTDLGNVCKHIARYNLALLYANQKDVLDIACGSGYGSFLLSTVARSVVAADISPVAIDYARTTYSSARITYQVSDAARVESEADLVVSFETIEHLNDIAAFEDAVVRNLRPGGKIIYSLPLNEKPGYNPYHRHVFNYASARTVFPRLKLQEELIQHGLNFYSPRAIPLDQQWLAYIGVAAKEL